jgi:hypothetical protein
MIHTLSVRFAGVCTHFRCGVVSGVPHRVVLPDATNITVGLLTIRDTPNPNPDAVFYYLLPHFPQIDVEGMDPEKLFVPKLVADGCDAMRNGDIFSGIRLQVLNAVDRTMRYENQHTPKLTAFDPGYSLSGDVVVQGRAVCYFDFYGGTVRSMQVSGGATQTVVEVETDGAPRLLVTPLASSSAPTWSHVLTLDHAPGRPRVAMVVKNLEAALEDDAPQQGGTFDFLLNYLTGHGGIPQVIQKAVPGMNSQTLHSMSPRMLAEALRRVADGLIAHPTPRRRLAQPDETTPSCSDSEYP